LFTEHKRLRDLRRVDHAFREHGDVGVPPLERVQQLRRKDTTNNVQVSRALTSMANGTNVESEQQTN
jgi:hypothetical protein